jgi:hypothetical protein
MGSILRIIVPILVANYRIAAERDSAFISNVFWVSVKIDGSKAEYEKLVLDTGSPFTWLYNYKILEGYHGTIVGGYGTTALRTVVNAPRGGNVIIYADNDRIECDNWTEKEFTLHSRKWKEPFGIASYVVQRAKKPLFTGLMGVSRDSNFMKSVDVFGFKPLSRNEAEMFYTPIQPEWCWNNTLVYFPISDNNRERTKHWASDEVVTFGGTEYNYGFILDTGASVIALPTDAFRDFKLELQSRGITFKYNPEKLSGVIPCSAMSELPSWYIGDKHTNRHFRVTPSMYVEELGDGNLCVLKVARVSAGHPIIFGLPVLRNSISEFNKKNHSLGLCVNRETDIENKPLTSGNRRGPRYYHSESDFLFDDRSSFKIDPVFLTLAITSIMTFIIVF